MDIKIEKKKGLSRKQIAYILLGLGLLAAVYFLSSYTPGNNLRMQKGQVTISEVKQGNFDDYIPLNGKVAPISTIYMDAYEGGRVVEKLIEEGETVKKGDIILKLENRGLYEQILASENNLALKQNDLRSTKMAFDQQVVSGRKDLVSAEYEVQQFKRNFEQNESLYADELIARETFLLSKEKYELAQKQHDIISAQSGYDQQLRSTSLKELDFDLERMKKTLTMIYERIDFLNVRAPADGQLGFLDAEIGQSIDRGERIGQINVLTDFKIESTIDEHYIDRVGRDLTAILERNGKTYQLKLRKVYPEVRNGKFKVDLVFTEGLPANIRTGQSFNLKLQLGESSEALLLPKGSFYQSTGGQWVFVLVGEIAVKRDVRLGKQNTRYYEVLEGLQAGERVITSNYESYGEAQKIILD